MNRAEEIQTIYRDLLKFKWRIALYCGEKIYYTRGYRVAMPQQSLLSKYGIFKKIRKLTK